MDADTVNEQDDVVPPRPRMIVWVVQLPPESNRGGGVDRRIDGIGRLIGPLVCARRHVDGDVAAGRYVGAGDIGHTAGVRVRARVSGIGRAVGGRRAAAAAAMQASDQHTRDGKSRWCGTHAIFHRPTDLRT